MKEPDKKSWKIRRKENRKLVGSETWKRPSASLTKTSQRKARRPHA